MTPVVAMAWISRKRPAPASEHRSDWAAPNTLEMDMPISGSDDRGRGSWLARWAGESFARLTTIGRRTGRPHRIEIWFGVEDGRLYLLAGGRDRADWVRNLQANPHVTVELGDQTRDGAARILQAGTAEDQRARELLVGKYRQGNDLDEWGRNSLPVAIEFSDEPSEGH
ncbi:MAG TPA: nitroreductase family deazaflavin-dependent oxidoreductase [Thermomicrobiales bacterium]|nr:nitroreductase family deazaflavin-dependent oxidoreductase [Thermomicrobiales bacterium]